MVLRMAGAQTVVFLGPEASYTHQAALAAFSAKEHKFSPLTTIPAVFASLQTGKADYGLVPFYNTTYGAVVTTLDSFATALVPAQSSTLASETQSGKPVSEAVKASSRTDGDARYPDVRIHGAVELAIRHCLLGHRKEINATDDSTTNGQTSEWSHIKRVYSHEQALGQCANFLSENLPLAERISVTSTSAAAQLVAEAKDKDGNPDTSIAAISSEMAAEMYNATLLQRDIQDHDDNSTRFFVLSKGPRDEETSRSNASTQKGKHTSLIAFTVSHSVPGALAKCLGLLERHGLNAVGIHQRPPDRLRKEDAIFVEVEGKAKDVEAALEGLEGLSEVCVCLGWWDGWS